MQAPAQIAGWTRVEGLIQRTPTNGQPISERTVVYLGYDDSRLYVFFVCFDDPSKLRARLVNRDLIPTDDDTVSIMLDTFHDRKRCYGFQVNARAVQNDAVWSEEGRVWDFSSDSVWDSEARITARGWIALISIPFKSFRFSPAPEQEWGVILYRGIPRKNEEAYWPFYNRDVAGRLNQAGELTGVSAVSSGRNIQVVPYTSMLDARGRKAQVGVDGKMIIRDSIVADVTVNPDFSQVESDAPQETVNQRFEVLFPEKRPFFIENATYFTTPINLLFTRRIVDPQFGVKLTGKSGRYGIGALAIDDEAPGKIAMPGSALAGQSARFAALRITRDLGTDSNVGAIVVSRTLAGVDNTVGGMDASLRISNRWTTQVQAVATNEGATAMHATVIGTSTNTTYQLDADDISNDFHADAGFITRVGIREAKQALSYRFHPNSGPLLSWGPDLKTFHVWDETRRGLEQTAEPLLTFEFPRQTVLSMAYTRGRETLIPREFPLLTTNVSLDDRRWGVELTTSALPRTTIYIETIGGTGINYLPRIGEVPYNAETKSVVGNFEYHPTDSLTLQGNTIRTAIDGQADATRAFMHRVERLKLSYQYSRAWSLRAIITRDRLDANPLHTTLISDRRNNTDLLLAYCLHPGTALYVGYNRDSKAGRQVFSKLSYRLSY